jgi:hypothetical protein
MKGGGGGGIHADLTLTAAVVELWVLWLVPRLLETERGEGGSAEEGR